MPPKPRSEKLPSAIRITIVTAPNREFLNIRHLFLQFGCLMVKLWSCGHFFFAGRREAGAPSFLGLFEQIGEAGVLFCR